MSPLAQVIAKEEVQGTPGLMVEVVGDPSLTREEEAEVVVEEAMKTKVTSNVFIARGLCM